MARGLALSLLLGLMVPGLATGGCPDGVYVVVGDPIFPGARAAAEVVRMEGGNLTVGGECPPTQARVRRKTHGTLVRARWQACGAQARRVRLRALLAPGCRVMEGAVRTGAPRESRRFVAHHRAQCMDTCDCRRSATFEHDCLLMCPNCGSYWTCDEGLCIEHCGPLPGPEPTCEPRQCDGIAGFPCRAGEFCEHPTGTCDVADQLGTCTTVPEACITLHDPVCGCDGVTYGNDCDRRAARAQKAYDGACRGPAAPGR